MLTDCMWQKILKANLLYVNHDMGDIWFGCPTSLYAVADKISNLFWQEIIKTFAILLEDIHYSHPYFFYNFNVFDNKLFSRNNIELKCADFISLWHKQICRGGKYDKKKTAKKLIKENCDPRMHDFMDPRLLIIHKISCFERKECRSFHVALKSR